MLPITASCLYRRCSVGRQVDPESLFLAAANLWEHGFNIERIISGNDQFEKDQGLPAGTGTCRIPRVAINVPLHLLRRYGLSPSVASVFHNPAEAEDLAAPGDMILMSWLPENDEAILLEMPMAVQSEAKG